MNYKLNDKKVFSDITDGIAILIDMESGIYYGLNLLSTNIYENIISGADTDLLLSKLKTLKGYNEEIEKKYSGFLQKLISLDFIVEDSTLSSDVHLNFDSLTNNELDFALSDYPDAQELLMADPIHQVKEQIGWQPNPEAIK